MGVRIALVALLLGSSPIAGVGVRSYTVDSSKSRATIEVGKSGMLSFAAGHSHEVAVSAIAGTIVVDDDSPAGSSARLTIDASALKVTGKGESADDVPKVQETMAGPQVLDVKRYPTIAFTSKSVAVTARTPTSMNLTITGELALHGMTRPLTVPVVIRTEGATLTATGHFAVKQSDYGIKPVSVAGVVSVKDSVAISFEIVAR